MPIVWFVTCLLKSFHKKEGIALLVYQIFKRLSSGGRYSDGGLKSAGGRYRFGQVSRIISASLSGVF